VTTSMHTMEPEIRARMEQHGVPLRRPLDMRRAVLVIWDVLVPLGLFAITAGLAAVVGGQDLLGPLSAPALLVTAVALAGLAFGDGYHRHIGGSPRIGHLFLISALAAWIGWIGGSAAGADMPLAQFAVVSALAPALWGAGRWAMAQSHLGRPERVLIIGSGQVAQRIVDLSERNPEMGLEIVGCIDDVPLTTESEGPQVLGRVSDLRAVLATREIDRVIVAFSLRNDAEILGVLRECDEFGASLDVVPRLFDLMGPRPVARSVGGLALVGVRGPGASTASMRIKRSMDVLSSAALLVLTAPIFLAVAIAIKAGDRGPILFRQVRVGENGRLFSCLKFRTMCVDAEKHEPNYANMSQDEIDIQRIVRELKTGDDPRITRVGRLLRKTSLDELPQLWNVLVGDMSMVGPRPLRPFEVQSLSGWQLVRQTVRPGITGLWQTLGRSSVGWEERMQMDYDYVRHWSIANDIRILMQTVRVVLVRKGAT
jgi:exopolysaccharide biosynthesis polyprenyl glycosylphosphotransferase